MGARDKARPRISTIPVLITLGTVSVAALLSWLAWRAYMDAPWTRDGQVRAYVITMTPEVAGRIVDLPIVDNRFVHKGDVLMTIDPTNYRIAVGLAEAAVQQAQINAENLQAEAKRRQELSTLSTSIEEKQTYESNAQGAQAGYRQAVANLDQSHRIARRVVRVRGSEKHGWRGTGDLLVVGRSSDERGRQGHVLRGIGGSEFEV
jgi:multidrug resistance efflux pump